MGKTRTLEDIIRHGNQAIYTQEPDGTLNHIRPRINNQQITCRDGFTVHVAAGYSMDSTPKPGDDAPQEYQGPYTHLEVWDPSDRPESWGQWVKYVSNLGGRINPHEATYRHVPAQMVVDLINDHGGEA